MLQNKYICDKCQKKDLKALRLTIKTSEDGPYENLDLCAACILYALKHLIKRIPMEERFRLIKRLKQ